MTVPSYHDMLVTVSFRQFVPFTRWNNFIVIISAWHISVLSWFQGQFTAHALSVDAYILKFMSIKFNTIICSFFLYLMKTYYFNKLV